MNWRPPGIVAALCLFSFPAVCEPTPALTADTVDYALPDYRVVPGITGTLSSVGSDTLANLMALWSEAFMRMYRGVNIQIQANGSGTAPPALIQSTSGLGPMSRAMTQQEEQAFTMRYGYAPTPVLVAMDALAIYVARDNPLVGLSVVEIDAIFSSTRKCGAAVSIDNWDQLVLDGSWARRRIQIFGRNAASGTYGYFKQKLLCRGDYKVRFSEQPGSAAVVRAVTHSRDGIGYAGMGYRGAGVRAVPIGDGPGQYVEATAANALNGRYPLARNLYIYVNKPPGAGLPAVQREFLHWVLSRPGQQLVARDGYIPLPSSIASDQYDKLKR